VLVIVADDAAAAAGDNGAEDPATGVAEVVDAERLALFDFGGIVKYVRCEGSATIALAIIYNIRYRSLILVLGITCARKCLIRGSEVTSSFHASRYVHARTILPCLHSEFKV